jgi:hypothetical protein
LGNKQQVAGDEVGRVKGGPVDGQPQIGLLTGGQLLNDRVKRLGKAAASLRHGPQGPDQTAEFTGSVPQHPAGNIEMRSCVGQISTGHRPPAGVELEAGTAWPQDWPAGTPALAPRG